MELRQLHLFCEVYRQRGFSAAARHLGLTQSAVSQAVRALETELGVSLFDASDRSRPTASGDYLFREGGLIRSQVDDLCNGIRTVGGVGGGTVKFGMIDVAATHLLPGVLHEFKKVSPDIKIEAVVKASGELMLMVERNELDFAIVVTNDIPDSLKRSEIYHDSIVAIVPEGSPLSRSKIAVTDLRGEPLILYPQSSHSRQLIEAVFREAGITPAVSMELHYPAAILALVQEGMGVGLISELSAREHALEGLVIVPVAELVQARQIGIVARRKRRSSPQAQALMERVGRLSGLTGPIGKKGRSSRK